MNIEFNGSLWENYDLYWDRSPIKYAHQIVTPTLIIHSDQDHICPIGQAQELFYALKNMGVPTELVIFEGENHGLSRGGKPVNLVERLTRMIDWFDDYLDPLPGRVTVSCLTFGLLVLADRRSLLPDALADSPISGSVFSRLQLTL